MTTVHDRTPVLIGVGQASEIPGRPGYQGLSPVDLAARAVRAAIADAGASGDLVGAIDTVAAIRQFEISTPVAVAPFGCSNNLPRSIAGRVGADPARAILEIGGGQGPQRLVGEMAQAIAEGHSDCVLITGSEAMSTALYLKGQGEQRDWSEAIGGQFEDRGYGIDGLFDPPLRQHGLMGAIPIYALFENARRALLGRSVQDCRDEIGRLFAPFTRQAAENPHAAAPVAYSAEQLATVSDRNRVVAEPYLRMTVARDQVNQAAALVLCSAGKARALGVSEDRWVHIHAVADADELSPLQRPALAKSPASIAAVEAALRLAGKDLADIAHFDFYSCFAVPVFNITDRFGLSIDDPRGLTLTGGLPFFGGAGNNYSMHAVAEAAGRARAAPGSFALVGANGGLMSKYSAAVYGSLPASWADPQARRVRLAKAADCVPAFAGEGARARLETYTVVPGKTGTNGVIVARTDSGARVVAKLAHDDAAGLARLVAGDVFGQQVDVAAAGAVNIFSFAD